MGGFVLGVVVTLLFLIQAFFFTCLGFQLGRRKDK